MIRGARGYAEHATELIERYESFSFADRHEAVLHLIPSAPAMAIDIGAGANAAWLAEQGHPVVAVEPTEAFRKHVLQHHPSPLIEWVNDALPRLPRVAQRRHEFSLVMLTAVWMHLDEQERQVAMPVVTALLAPAEFSS